MTDRALLRVEKVHVFYGQSHVLHGASLDVEGGLVTVIAGRNGVGKTTLVNTIMGLVPAESGSIRFQGQELLRLPATARRGLGLALAPQGRRVFRSLTVDEHLGLVPTGSDSPFTRDWIFETFPRLAERRRSLARTLSGGEQSMLSIARALTANPRLLVMDEPTEGLAPLLVDTVRSVVEQLREMGLTVLLVEQNLRFAIDVADRIAIMHRGEFGQVFEREMLPDAAALSEMILTASE